VISSTSGPISAPRNEVAARSRVSCFIADRTGSGRLRLHCATRAAMPGYRARQIGFHRSGFEATDSARRCRRCSSKSSSISPSEHADQGSRPQPCRGKRLLGLVETTPGHWRRVRAAPHWFRRKYGCDRSARIWRLVVRSALWGRQHFSVLPISGQPSSPGICVSELRFSGGGKVTVGEATLCIDMGTCSGFRGPRLCYGEGSRGTPSA